MRSLYWRCCTKVQYKVQREPEVKQRILFNYVINTNNLMYTSLSLSLTLYWGSMSRHVSGITCPSSVSIARTQIWWLLCAVVDVGWSRDVGRLLREGKGVAIGRAVRPDRSTDSCIVKGASSWLCLLRNYVPMLYGQQNIKFCNYFVNYQPNLLI
jgi:hypothetical protein